MLKITDETGTYVELPREKIKFDGDTVKERKLNETIFDISLEYSEVCDENYELKKEIERLQNIINELEKCIKEEYDYCDNHIDPAFGTGMGVAKRLLDKLKVLKENK